MVRLTFAFRVQQVVLKSKDNTDTTRAGNAVTRDRLSLLNNPHNAGWRYRSCGRQNPRWRCQSTQMARKVTNVTPGTERNPERTANPKHAICHTPPNITLSHWLFYLGYVPFLELHLVLKLSIVNSVPSKQCNAGARADAGMAPGPMPVSGTGPMPVSGTWTHASIRHLDPCQYQALDPCWYQALDPCQYQAPGPMPVSGIGIGIGIGIDTGVVCV